MLTKQKEINSKRSNKNITMSGDTSSHYAVAMSNGNGVSYVRRIRTPSETDVLSGRGGSVNQHAGNIQFRQWVSERKYDYNLASSKVEKANICREVIAKVTSQNPPGRFLGRETASSSWWIELDDERVMAKTSQALREGAPKIREAHQEEIVHNKQQKASRRPRVVSKREAPRKGLGIGPQEIASINATVSARAPLLTEKAQQERALQQLEANASSVAKEQTHNTIYSSSIPRSNNVYSSCTPETSPSVYNQQQPLQQDNKRVRLDYHGKEVRPNDETPPLHPLPAPDDPSMDPLCLTRNQCGKMEIAYPEIPSPRPLSDTSSKKGMKRSHSLALSDTETSIGDWANDDFVNPFEDEDDVLVRKSSSSSRGMLEPRLGVLRESSNSSNGDLAGLGALMRQQSAQNNNNDQIHKSCTSGGSSEFEGAELSTGVRSWSNNANTVNSTSRYADDQSGDWNQPDSSSSQLDTWLIEDLESNTAVPKPVSP